MAKKTPRDRLFRYRIGQQVRWAGDAEVQPARIHQRRYAERVPWLGPVTDSAMKDGAWNCGGVATW